MFELYPYQQTMIDEINQGIHDGYRRQILTAPTGSGKTVTIARIIHDCVRNRQKPLFVVDRKELVHQACDKLQRYGLQAGILQGDNTRIRLTDDCTVATIQSINSRGVDTHDLIVIDECHILHQRHRKLIEEHPEAPVIGLSATPMRDSLGQLFQRMVRGPTVRALMESGHLVPKVRIYAPRAQAMRELLQGVSTATTRWGTDYKPGALGEALNSKTLIGDMIATWQEKASDRQTIVFCVNIAHADAVAEEFRRAGARAESIHSRIDAEERDSLIDGFRCHDIQILTSVDVLGTGFDAPTVSCGIFARPTLSEIVFIQQAGRMLRPADGKHDAILLDHAGNTLRHGLPQDFVPPELDARDDTPTKEKKKQSKATACRGCDAVLPPGIMTCPECGLDRLVRKDNVIYIDGVLVEKNTTPQEEEHAASTMKEWFLALLWMAMHSRKRDGSPYSVYWAKYAWETKFKTDKNPPRHWWDEQPVMPDDEQFRWIKSYQIRVARRFAKRDKS